MIQRQGARSPSAAALIQERSTSPLFAPEPSYFYPYAHHEFSLPSPNGSDTKPALSHTSQDGSLYLHGAIRDLQKLRALYIPFISSEEDLTPSSTSTTQFVSASPTVSLPSSRSRLPRDSSISVTSPPGSARHSFLSGKFTPPVRANARSGRLIKSYPSASPVTPAPKRAETEIESVPDFLPDFSSRILNRFVELINSIDMQSLSGKEHELGELP
ncbi:predicted protein [Uncinocarpus reesii 1704]|uniref:Uncharacterized protein n=1 Tax=Uncinocarpus reesii (strain UAMH 1704) TaxID=336963 RepID=C4JX55_UNCRE|nr:uncharacterized protein UREG_06228 [Uncinocarpus reesii 1704]EEP81363.1 predicted protein [Uncinocarpus reesii 1704]